MLNLVYDRCELGRPYPNLAPLIDASNGYHGLGDEYPYIAPIRLYYYAQDHNFPINVSYINDPLPSKAFYPVGISWFDFSLDYFELMSEQVCSYLRDGKLRVLFYYHEGDNPHHEKARLDELCSQHNLPTDCYRFISGNTQADVLENFVYFPDHELFYWRNSVKWNNRSMPGVSYHDRPRSHRYTALNRIHKWWRATAIADLHRNNLLTNSYWSYNTEVTINDRIEDNPIEIDTLEIRLYLADFLSRGPYRADALNSAQHNDHSLIETEHYQNSYCNIVLETHFDADQSGGTFLTEKTFKPIKHGQPFIIVGPAGSLATLRNLGYRTFDHAIDNSYDLETNNTQRWLRVLDAIQQIKQQDMHRWFKLCQVDLRNFAFFFSW